MDKLERLNQINIALFELKSKPASEKNINDVWAIIDLEDELDELKYQLNQDELEYKELN